MEEAEQFEHCLMLDGGHLLAAGPSHELAAVTPSGKLDDAFTHYQARARRSINLCASHRARPQTARSPSRPTT